MALHEQLLTLARELMPSNSAAPAEANLRRGISTAYYALYHLLVHEATTRLVAIPSLRPRIARAYDHKSIKLVCQEYDTLAKNATGQLITSAGQVVPRGLKEIASQFVLLQQARHQADYDTAATITPEQAEAEVLRAEFAFLEWEVVKADPAADTFLAELLCRSIPKR